LRVAQHALAGGRVANVAYGEATLQAFEDRGAKGVSDEAHGAMCDVFATVRGDDAAGLLAAMLKGVEAQVGQMRGFFASVDAEDAALVVEAIRAMLFLKRFELVVG
jgi:hypothetical protein